MGLSTLLSFITIALTISLLRFIPHRSYLLVLVGIPSLALVGGLCTILRKTITRGRSHQRVSAEVAWTFSLLPFEFIIALFSTNITGDNYTPEVTQRFTAVTVIIWTNCALVSIYIIVLLTLSTITQFAFDAEVWKRDIDGSPSPFPMSIIVPYALPFTARFFLCPSPMLQMTTTTTAATAHAYCLPGCTCTRKLHSPPSPPQLSTAPLLSSRTGSTSGGSTRSIVPVRLPTEMERRRSILVVFDGPSVTAADM